MDTSVIVLFIGYSFITVCSILFETTDWAWHFNVSMQLRVLYSLDTVEQLYMSRVSTCLDLSNSCNTPPPPRLKVYYWFRSPICLMCGENYHTLIQEIFSRIATLGCRKYLHPPPGSLRFIAKTQSNFRRHAPIHFCGCLQKKITMLLFIVFGLIWFLNSSWQRPL